MNASDKEFYSEFLTVRAHLMGNGWEEESMRRENDMITVTFSKNGYSIHMLFGCAEKIKQEVL